MRLLVCLLVSLCVKDTAAVGCNRGFECGNVDEQPEDDVYPCNEQNTNNSFIYCHGALLAAVNLLHIFNDSKTFVDMPMKGTPKETLELFEERFGNQSIEQIDVDKLNKFLDEAFTEPGTELEQCNLTDWTEQPPKLMRILDPTMRKFALDMNAIWKDLCRKMKPEADGDHNSLIFVPNEFVVPGGRFREFYYWDAYWIIKGLLASGMTKTTKSMLLNFMSVVQRFGFLPNGGRIYYLQRSQPPFLTGMVYEYFEETHDTDFLKDALPILETEMAFWQNNRTVTTTVQGKEYTVYRYRTNANVPRPESYAPDWEVAQNLTDNSAKQRLYRNLASAAESGWDFSTRWFADGRTLQTIQTSDIAPLDLNSLICWNFRILEYLYRQISNTTAADYYREERERLKRTLHEVFFNDTHGAWFDLNLVSHTHNVNFFPSLAMPLFAECYDQIDVSITESAFRFMNSTGAFSYPGGVPASLTPSGQQWDFPNGWSPLVHMIIEAFRKTDSPILQQQALEIAQGWVLENFRVFNATRFMWEKYDVNGRVPEPGAGGEYQVQKGFGWTNGAVLDLLVTYGDRININSTVSPTGSRAQTHSLTDTLLSVITATLVAFLTY